MTKSKPKHEKPMTMKQFEKSPEDKKVDRKELAKINAKREGKKK